ncbi:MAG TPA: threonine--tRNA ligase [Candidatus Paceibacterota bacterium]|nr:threonine--tRNA ligase [Candidatus Paceibacterota bacterium]HRZ54613.1 threonine--tRNA ligase [Candidatus Paceibacterota bacterium]
MSNENQPPADRKTLDQRNAMTDLERLRHSCAHVMANAIVKLWPDAQFAAGPPVAQGFYYDVELEHRITPEDFPAIEAEMKAIIKANQPFERMVVTRDQALADARRGRLAALGDRPVASKFKIGNLEDIPEGEAISYYRNGDFIDLCAGPHVMRTGNIGAFKLNSVASAYYKGDEKNPQVQRVYGIAFKNKTQLDEWLEMQEEAKKRDHRKIGVEMGLFVIDPDYTGPGMPLWLPNGTVLVEELEKLAKETEFAAGYRRVRTPHLAKERMYRTSGHLPYYAESMFPPMEMHETAQVPAPESKDAPPPVDRYYLKAMNCPHHHRIFAAEPRSYRDLPLRLAEYGCCYRYEQSGELFGLMRVRSLNMNDAHIYCTEDQFAQEFNAVNDMYLKYFKIFGIEKYVMRFSTHGKEGLGKKYVNEPELWVKTEEMVRQVLIDSKINYIEVPNEAAFYGPKIDVQVWSVIGREFTLATNQVDFAVPAKFGLTYRDRDNTDKTPLCIHRAPLGTHERFIGFLIEHYAGNFPLWLAPEQVRVLPVTEAQIDYAKGIVDELRAQQVRAEIEFSNDKLMGRIQRAEAARVHHILVVGGREREANAVAVRIHGKGQQGVRPRSEVVAEILESIRERRF